MNLMIIRMNMNMTIIKKKKKHDNRRKYKSFGDKNSWFIFNELRIWINNANKWIIHWV